LIGIEQDPDGRRRAVSIRLARGRAVASEVVEPDLLVPDQSSVTLSGNDFYFLTRQERSAGSGSEIVVRRVRLN
jgi:hypothetical protein